VSSPPSPSSLATDRVRELYRRRAARFDLVAASYRLFGVRLAHYRRLAVAALGLRAGATVADLGCGTGLALPALAAAVGPAGRVIGVDLTDRMLDVAQRRIDRLRLDNVELVEADLGTWNPSTTLDGALAILSLSLLPEVEETIQRLAALLRPGGRLAVVDLRRPEGVPRWLVALGVHLNRGFGVDPTLLDRPLDSSIHKYLHVTKARRFYADAVFLSVAERRAGV